MNIYVQQSGQWFRDGSFLAQGYSGYLHGLNNPGMQDVHDTGPIPQGFYTISGPPYDSPEHGPFVMRLVPNVHNIMFGRDGFLIHGDLVNAAANPNAASRGCIILGKQYRMAIWDSQDRNLQVVGYRDEGIYSC